MRSRCRNPKDPAYRKYGGRGIAICERWDLFENFLADMGPRPAGHSVERKDNDGNYEPENCKWATRIEQNRNRSVSYTAEEDRKILDAVAQGLGFKSVVA